ncbi:MAG: hypothetical protein M3361_05395 [Candidatus Tectomicrobia bacterium]|nr:hypothetical protein [Candidatus Tectomicrobia bacterium]
MKERRVGVEKIEKGPLALTQEKGDVQMLRLIMGEIGRQRKEDGIEQIAGRAHDGRPAQEI